MKNLLMIALGLILGVGIMFVVDKPQTGSTNGALAYNCELSGGTVENGACTCPLELNQTQNQMYDERTGFCQSTFGGPAGDAFFASIGLPYGRYSYWNNIMVELCTESGGTRSGAACICPTGKSFSENSGKCE